MYDNKTSYKTKESVPLIKKIFSAHSTNVLNVTNDFVVLVKDYFNEDGFHREREALCDIFSVPTIGKRIYAKSVDTQEEQKIAVLQIIKELEPRFNYKAIMFAIKSVTLALGWDLKLVDMAGFRLIGSSDTLPSFIEVNIVDKSFTIGRFDVSVGKKQSDFEFDKKTRGVSRFHAKVEQLDSGYCIIDLSSKAGTFVNNERITPNVPCKLEHGVSVSFGTSGVDYVWEE